MFDSVLFDLDGTLINSAEGITEGVRYALKKHNKPSISYELREKFIGPPIRDSFMKICGADAETAAQLLATYREYYAEKGLHQCVPYQGIRELLERLRNKGKTLLVATAKPTLYSRIILDEWELSGYFQEIVGAEFNKNFETKDKIVALAKTMAVGKSVMVGDTIYDVLGAHANDLPAIGVLYGFGDHAELYASKPEYIAASVEEIEGFI